MAKYTLSHDVTCYRADFRRNLRPTAFLDMAQDIATKAAEELSFGDKVLGPMGCAWVLTRQHAEFLRPVKYCEALTLQTWHKGLHGINFVRDYQLLDASGTPVVNSTSSWVVMDVAARRLSRNPELFTVIPEEPQDPDNAIETPAPKIVMPRDSEAVLAGEHRVVWSDVDFNGHANNVRYSVWAMDCIPEDMAYSHNIRSLTVNFNREAHPGSTVQLMRAEVDGGYVVEGLVDGQQSFIVKLIFD